MTQKCQIEITDLAANTTNSKNLVHKHPTEQSVIQNDADPSSVSSVLKRCATGYILQLHFLQNWFPGGTEDKVFIPVHKIHILSSWLTFSSFFEKLVNRELFTKVYALSKRGHYLEASCCIGTVCLTGYSRISA